jgi:hypothetical protein
MLIGVAIALLMVGLAAADSRADGATTRPAGAAASQPAWVALGKDVFAEAKFDPRNSYMMPAADRTTGDVFLFGWGVGMGVWKSSDGGKSFTHVDGGKINGNLAWCGPLCGYSVHISPEGKKIAVFTMYVGPATPPPGLAGYSLDGGATWTSFTSIDRNFNFGAMDWDSQSVVGVQHEGSRGLFFTVDAGKTWTRVRDEGDCTGVGVVGQNTLLLGIQDRIERSEDGGKTWKKVSDLGPALGPMLKFKNSLWWLSESNKSVIVSGDQGKTWAVQGEALPTIPVVGPFFGKDESHIVVATQAGFYETTDGCKNWKLAVALPEGYTLKRREGLNGNGSAQQGTAAFDPVHDAFYYIFPGKALMKYCRSAPAGGAGNTAKQN